MSRVAGRGNRPDRFECEDTVFFDRVRRVYLELAAQEPGRFRIIDATASEGEVAASVRRAIDAAFPSAGS
jgi:dTMP kinase